MKSVNMHIYEIVQYMCVFPKYFIPKYAYLLFFMTQLLGAVLVLFSVMACGSVSRWVVGKSFSGLYLRNHDV